MNLGIYKPGQGYWVRVMTAVFAGLIVLATAGWLWREMSAVNLPIRSWNHKVVGATGTVAPGQPVELVARTGSGAGTEVVIGTATVRGWEETVPGVGTVNLVDTQMNEGDLGRKFSPTETKYIRTAGGFSGEVTSSSAKRVFQQMYLQAAAAGLVILIGAALLYWIVGLSRRSSDFLISTDGEMKKVNWSTRRHIIGSTWVVVGACVLIATTLWLVDTGFATFFRVIGVLE